MGGLFGGGGGRGGKGYSPSKVIGGGGGQRLCCPPPPSKVIEGVGGWGLPPWSPSSYAYVSFVNVYQFVCLLLFLMVLRVGMDFDYIYSGSLPFFLF